MKNLEYYLKLPYTIVVRQDDEGDFVARVEELRGCTAHGTSANEAIGSLEDVKRLWFEEAIAAEIRIPEPETDENRLPSGRWVQRVPRSLHRKLVQHASKEGVSLNQFVVSVLAEAVGHREGQAAKGTHTTVIADVENNIWRGQIDVYTEGERLAGDLWEIHQPGWRGIEKREDQLVEGLRNVHLVLSEKRSKKLEASKHGDKKEKNYYYIPEC